MPKSDYKIEPFANLRGADLMDADLRGADLRGADLRGADLGDANLMYANLMDADLMDADLRGADLGDANLIDANLMYANLGDANLGDANLRGADLRGAGLGDANLRGANLRGADLRGADLRGAKNIPQYVQDVNTITPTEGSFIGWKKAGGCIIKLSIPADAKRSNATGRKCRAEFVDVLEVYGDPRAAYTDRFGPYTFYEKGRRIHANTWDENRWNECSNGIHFYMTRGEAERH